MNPNLRLLAPAMLVLACAATPVSAADRMRAGQWDGTTLAGGRTFQTSNCISQGDADAMNGDAKAVQEFLEKSIPPSICQITDLKAQGSVVVYTASCGDHAPKVLTTTYHGDSFEGSDNTGTKTEGKLVGPCK